MLVELILEIEQEILIALQDMWDVRDESSPGIFVVFLHHSDGFLHEALDIRLVLVVGAHISAADSSALQLADVAD